MHKEQQCIIMDLTKKHIENRLSLNSDNPVSRQFEGLLRLLWMADVLGRPKKCGSYSCPFIVRDRDEWKESCQGEKAA